MISSSWHFIIIAFPQVFSSDTRSRSFVNPPLSINNPNNHNRSFHMKRIFYQLTETGLDLPGHQTHHSFRRSQRPSSAACDPFSMDPVTQLKRLKRLTSLFHSHKSKPILVNLYIWELYIGTQTISFMIVKKI